MRIGFFVPTYWARPTTEKHQRGDLIFDHPTPIDAPGTLSRILESFTRLHDQKWTLIIGIATTTETITEAAYRRVHESIAKLPATLRERVSVTGEKEVRWLQERLKDKKVLVNESLVTFKGYPGIRNLGLLAGVAAGIEVLTMVDDDQVFEDLDFVTRIRETADTSLDGKKIEAWSGYCPETTGFLRVRPFESWMKHWDKIGAQNEAYQALIGVAEPRWKFTPLAFGGCFLVKRNVFMRLPFDPHVGRGEDMDYLMNARMFGIVFYLDNRLSMLHLPPPRAHSQWQRMREDMTRYLYQREKIRRQKSIPGMITLRQDDLLPYPGLFLGEDLDDRIIKSNTDLAKFYHRQKDPLGEQEALRNIEIAERSKYPDDPFEALVKLQKNWEDICRVVDSEKKLWGTQLLK